MSGQLQGKIAIVTGGTQGLGATIAGLFAERGAEGIVICGRNAAKGRAKAEQIGKAAEAYASEVRSRAFPSADQTYRPKGS